MPPFLPILPTHLDSPLLDLSVFGELSLPEGPSELNFQLDVVPAKCPDQFWFGLIEMDRCH